MNRIKFINHVFLGLTVWVTFTLTGCLSPPDLENTPEITNVRLSKNFMDQGSLNKDSIVFIIEFTDGDGNFGSDNTSNVFIKDSRKENLIYEFKAPTIPEQGTKNGIRGTIYLTMYSVCCFTDQNPSCCLDNFGCPSKNSLHFEVSIKDREGLTSNSFVTETIDLFCI